MMMAFDTSPRDETLHVARFTAAHAGIAAEDPQSLRWVVVGAALMTQNACVAALEGADASGQTQRRKDLWKARRAGDEAPTPNRPVVSLLELLARVSDESIVAQPFTLPLRQDAHAQFAGLMELRNAFLHLPPGETSIDLTELPDLLGTACNTVRHLMVTQPTFASEGWAKKAVQLGGDLDYIANAADFLQDYD